MIRAGRWGALLFLVVAGAPLPARAADALKTDGWVVALAGGSGGSPLGHLGLEVGWAHRRLEVTGGLGVFIGHSCLGEEGAHENCTAPVASVGVGYAVLRRGAFELAPGLGLSLQQATYQDQITRPSYGTITWKWKWSVAPRLNADLAARYRVGSWSFGLVGGAGVIVGGASECEATAGDNVWACSSVPSPAYAAPTPFAVTGYGQLVIGRAF